MLAGRALTVTASGVAPDEPPLLRTPLALLLGQDVEHLQPDHAEILVRRGEGWTETLAQRLRGMQQRGITGGVMNHLKDPSRRPIDEP